MLKKILRRLVFSIIVLVGISVIAFALVRLAPGDPARLMLGATASEEQIEAMHVKMGLDQPYIVQYFNYIKGVLQGDLGYSYYFGMSCNELIFGRLPATAKLTLAGLIVILIISVPLGITAGIKKGSGIDTFSMFFSLLGQSLSPVWLGLIMILIFGVNLGWLPTQGTGSMKHIIMPGIVMGFQFCSMTTRLLRSGMAETLEEDYITATRARGVSRFKIYTIYALKNAVLPVVTNMGNNIGTMMAGSMVIETIFGWPGLGELTIRAINLRDFQLVQSILLVSAFIFVCVNLIVDILYCIIDRRIEFN